MAVRIDGRMRASEMISDLATIAMGGIAATAIVAAASPALADCLPPPTGANPNQVVCSGVVPAGKAQFTTGAFTGSLNVLVDPTGVISDGVKITLTDAGSNATYTSAGGSSVANAGIGVDIATPTGNILVNSTGNIAATTQAIKTVGQLNGSTVLNVTGGSINGTTGNTIETFTGGAGATVITANVPILSTGAAGIYAISNSGFVTVNGTGPVNGATDGIHVEIAGKADINVLQGGQASGTAGTGVFASSGGGNITVATGGGVAGGTNGITATTIGSGIVQVNTGGAVLGTAVNGINTSSADGATVINVGHDVTGGSVGIGAGNIGNGAVLMSLTGGTVTGKSFGIAVNEIGAGGVSITNTGTNIAGGVGIQVQNRGTDATVVTHSGGAIFGAANAILINNGTGNVTVTASGAIAPTTGDTISTFTLGPAATVIAANTSIVSTGATGIAAAAAGGPITINGSGSVTGSAGGIKATTSGAGEVKVTQAGAIVGNTGVTAKSLGGNVTVATGSSITGALTGVDAATTGNGTVNVNTGGAITASGGTAVKTTTGSGDTSIVNGHTIAGATTAIASLSAGGGKVSVLNNGTITGAINVVGANAATSSVDNNGTWNTIANSTIAGKLNNTGTINIADGTTTSATVITNASTINIGAGSALVGTANTLTNNSTINVAANGLIVDAGAVTNKNAINFNGPGGTGAITSGKTIDNTGQLKINDGDLLLTAPVVTAGNIDALNGKVGNTVTVNGAYTGTGTVKLDSNTSTGVSDKLVVNGTTAGKTGLVLNSVGQGVVQQTQVVAGDASGGRFVFAGGNALDPFANGLVQYNLDCNATGCFIVGAINGGAISGLTNLASSVATISTSFHQPASNFVNAKPNPAANDTQIGIWARGDAARFTVHNTTSLLQADGTAFQVPVDARLRIRYEAIQSGLDYGWLNINNSKWNAHVGVTAGTVVGRVTTPGVTTDLDAPFITGYVFVTNGQFTFDVTARHEWHNAEFASAVFDTPTKRADGNADAIAAVATYRFNSGNWFVTPAAGISYTRSHLDPIQANSIARVDAGSDDALVGRAALQVSYAIPITQTFVVQPFASAAASRNYTNVTDSFLRIEDPNGLTVFRADTTGVRDSMQYTAGIAAAETKLGVTTFISGSVREGDRITGGSVTAGGRINF